MSVAAKLFNPANPFRRIDAVMSVIAPSPASFLKKLPSPRPISEARRIAPEATNPAERGAIIVIVYNRVDDGLDCLESLKRQLPAGVEIILVDNGSKEDLRPPFLQRFPGLRTLRIEPNRGWSAAANRAADLAMDLGAPRIYFLNDDTIVQPRFWESCEEGLEKHGADIVASIPVYFSQPEIIQTAGVTIDLPWMEIHHRGAEQVYGDAYRGFHACDAIIGTGMMFRSSAFRELGGFEEKYQIFFEEIDICLRAARRGYKIGVAGDSIIWHRTARTVGRHSPNYFYHFFRNRIWCAHRHMRPRDYWLHLPYIVTRDVVRAARQIPELKKRPELWRAVTRGIWHGIAGYRNVWGERAFPPTTPQSRSSSSTADHSVDTSSPRPIG